MEPMEPVESMEPVEPVEPVVPMETRSKKKARAKPLTVNLKDRTTSCPLFLGAHVKESTVEKIREILKEDEGALRFADPRGYGARPAEATMRQFETPVGAKFAGMAERLANESKLYNEIGQAFMQRMPNTVIKNVKAGCL